MKVMEYLRKVGGEPIFSGILSGLMLCEVEEL